MGHTAKTISYVYQGNNNNRRVATFLFIETSPEDIKTLQRAHQVYGTESICWCLDRPVSYSENDPLVLS